MMKMIECAHTASKWEKQKGKKTAHTLPKHTQRALEKNSEKCIKMKMGKKIKTQRLWRERKNACNQRNNSYFCSQQTT